MQDLQPTQQDRAAVTSKTHLSLGTCTVLCPSSLYAEHTHPLHKLAIIQHLVLRSCLRQTYPQDKATPVKTMTKSQLPQDHSLQTIASQCEFSQEFLGVSSILADTSRSAVHSEGRHHCLTVKGAINQLLKQVLFACIPFSEKPHPLSFWTASVPSSISHKTAIISVFWIVGK